MVGYGGKEVGYSGKEILSIFHVIGVSVRVGLFCRFQAYS